MFQTPLCSSPFHLHPFFHFFSNIFQSQWYSEKGQESRREERTANLLHLNCFHFLGVKDNDIVVRLYFGVFLHIHVKAATPLLKQPPNDNSYHYPLVFCCKIFCLSPEISYGKHPGFILPAQITQQLLLVREYSLITIQENFFKFCEICITKVSTASVKLWQQKLVSSTEMLNFCQGSDCNS